MEPSAGSDHLVDQPVGGQGLGQVLQQPHTVVLDHHPACAGLFLQTGQVLGIQLGLVLDHLDGGARKRKLAGLVLHFPLLAHQQQGLVPRIEVGVLKGLLDEGGLAALQKAHKQVDRYFLCHKVSP